MKTYVLVPWDKCQKYIEEQWFYKEAVLAVGAEEKAGYMAYFIPEYRIVSRKNQ